MSASLGPAKWRRWQRLRTVSGSRSGRGVTRQNVVEAGGSQCFVLCCVAQPERQRDRGDAGRVAVDDHHCLSFTLKIGGHCAPNTTPPAQHNVAVELGDLLVHSMPPKNLSQLTFYQHLYA